MQSSVDHDEWVPDYSFGPHLDSDTMMVVRVNEGPFKDTVFCLLSVIEDVVEYELLLFIYEGKQMRKRDERLLQLLSDNAIIPIANELIENVKRKVAEK